MKIQVWVTDDHKLFRQGLIALLRSKEDMSFTGEAENGSELLFKLQAEQPDVILMDVEMPETDGLSATAEIRTKYPAVKILALSMHKEDSFILGMMEAGAHGYLFKESEPEEVIKAIYSVQQNGFYFNDSVSVAMLNQLMEKKKVDAHFHENQIELNEREKEVLLGICQEKTNAEIGEDLFLGKRTIEDYRAKLLRKTGAKNTAGLVIFAIKDGYFSV